MKIYISVVSHGHGNIIRELGCLVRLLNAENSSIYIVLKSNIDNEDFHDFLNYSNFHWINEGYYNGFGHNNNIVYNYCGNNLGMCSNDLFIVMNPDVDISTKSLFRLKNIFMSERICFGTINLFSDVDYSNHDNSIRRFPKLSNFISSFLGFENKTIICKEDIHEPVYVDWAAGSFLFFSSEHYSKLRGFDENYFMYCEDIDICFRSKSLGIPLKYIPYVHAIHFAQHSNRKLFSRHFYWHLKSAFRFIMSTKISISIRSLVK